MQDAEPPTDTVIEAFKAVETAKQGKETAINILCLCVLCILRSLRNILQLQFIEIKCLI